MSCYLSVKTESSGTTISRKIVNKIQNKNTLELKKTLKLHQGTDTV